jgi:hypothetical protein
MSFDPAGFVTVVPNWGRRGDDQLSRGEKCRILEIRTELLPAMLDAGFNGIFVVEPALTWRRLRPLEGSRGRERRRL